MEQKLPLYNRLQVLLLNLLRVYPHSQRENWVKLQIESIEAGKKILDAGCGWQIYRPYCSHLQYYSQDFGKYDGIGDGEGAQTRIFEYGKLDYVGNIWEINEVDNFFDVILCTEVIEHVPYPNETIKELYRIIKPGGVLLITAPFNSAPHMTPYYYYSGFASNWYRYSGESLGLEIESMEFCGNAMDKNIFDLLRISKFISFIPFRVGYLVITALFIVPFLKIAYFFMSDTSKDSCFGLFVRYRKKC